MVAMFLDLAEDVLRFPPPPFCRLAQALLCPDEQMLNLYLGPQTCLLLHELSLPHAPAQTTGRPDEQDRRHREHRGHRTVAPHPAVDSCPGRRTAQPQRLIMQPAPQLVRELLRRAEA